MDLNSDAQANLRLAWAVGALGIAAAAAAERAALVDRLARAMAALVDPPSSHAGQMSAAESYLDLLALRLMRYQHSYAAQRRAASNYRACVVELEAQLAAAHAEIARLYESNLARTSTTHNSATINTLSDSHPNHPPIISPSSQSLSDTIHHVSPPLPAHAPSHHTPCLFNSIEDAKRMVVSLIHLRTQENNRILAKIHQILPGCQPHQTNPAVNGGNKCASTDNERNDDALDPNLISSLSTSLIKELDQGDFSHILSLSLLDGYRKNTNHVMADAAMQTDQSEQDADATKDQAPSLLDHTSQSAQSHQKRIRINEVVAELDHRNSQLAIALDHEHDLAGQAHGETRALQNAPNIFNQETQTRELLELYRRHIVDVALDRDRFKHHFESLLSEIRMGLTGVEKRLSCVSLRQIVNASLHRQDNVLMVSEHCVQTHSLHEQLDPRTPRHRAIDTDILSVSSIRNSVTKRHVARSTISKSTSIPTISLDSIFSFEKSVFHRKSTWSLAIAKVDDCLLNLDPIVSQSSSLSDRADALLHAHANSSAVASDMKSTTNLIHTDIIRVDHQQAACCHASNDGCEYPHRDEAKIVGDVMPFEKNLPQEPMSSASHNSHTNNDNPQIEADQTDSASLLAQKSTKHCDVQKELHHMEDTKPTKLGIEDDDDDDNKRQSPSRATCRKLQPKSKPEKHQNPSLGAFSASRFSDLIAQTHMMELNQKHLAARRKAAELQVRGSLLDARATRLRRSTDDRYDGRLRFLRGFGVASHDGHRRDRVAISRVSFSIQ